MPTEQEIWQVLHQHLHAIYAGDPDTYQATTHAELSLYEWFVTPHRIDGLPFHRFMMEHSWSGSQGADWRYDLLEPRLQIFGDCAIASYTLVVSTFKDGSLRNTSVNESRVLVKFSDGWKVVHVHKSPAGGTPP